MQNLEIPIGLLSDLEVFRGLSSKELFHRETNPLLNVVPSVEFKTVTAMAVFLHNIGKNLMENRNRNGEEVFIDAFKQTIQCSRTLPTWIDHESLSTLDAVSFVSGTHNLALSNKSCLFALEQN